MTLYSQNKNCSGFMTARGNPSIELDLRKVMSCLQITNFKYEAIEEKLFCALF